MIIRLCKRHIVCRHFLVYLYIFFCSTTCIRSVLYSESTRVDISNIFALLVFENRRLQRSQFQFKKTVIGNLSQQDIKMTAVSIKCKFECVLY